MYNAAEAASAKADSFNSSAPTGIGIASREGALAQHYNMLPVWEALPDGVGLQLSSGAKWQRESMWLQQRQHANVPANARGFGTDLIGQRVACWGLSCSRTPGHLDELHTLQTFACFRPHQIPSGCQLGLRTVATSALPSAIFRMLRRGESWLQGQFVPGAVELNRAHRNCTIVRTGTAQNMRSPLSQLSWPPLSTAEPDLT